MFFHLLFAHAFAVAETVELGSLAAEAAARDAYKLDVCAFSQAVTLTTFSPWLDASGGEILHAVAYRWTGGNTWNLEYDGGEWVPDADVGHQDFDVSWEFEAGSTWAIGLWIGADAVGYGYGDVGLQEFSWGTCGGIVFSASGDTPILPAEIHDDPGAETYRFNLTLEVPADNDLDGYSELIDCDDADPAVHPEAAERCNGRDDDCDETIDEEVADVTYWLDADADGYADADGPSVVSCEDPEPGYTVIVGDCDDNNAAAFPGAAEVCDDADNDCDAEEDEGMFEYWFWPDADADGFGDPSFQPESTCENSREGMVWNDRDCDDTDAGVAPETVELCDQIDQDCDGLIDEDFPLVDHWPDADGDGYGDVFAAAEARCDVSPAGYVPEASDCADDDATRFPGAPEECNGVDDDCSGTIDEDENVDSDADGVLDCGDCAPNDNTVFPDAPEACDGVDHNCDGAPRADCEGSTTGPTTTGPADEPNDVVGTGACAGCNGANGTPGLVWLGAFALLARRRLA